MMSNFNTTPPVAPPAPAPAPEVEGPPITPYQARIAEMMEEPCYICEKPFDPYEARMLIPGHDVQMHIDCGNKPHTFHQPVHSDAGYEAAYWDKVEAEEAIKAYDAEDYEEMKDGTWEIREVEYTPAAYFQMPEFDGF